MTLLVISPVGMLDLRDLKFHCLRISIGRQTIDNRASRIPKPQEFRYLIESLPGRVVAGVSDVLIGPKTLVLVCQIKMGVPTGHDQSQHREINIFFVAIFVVAIFAVAAPVVAIWVVALPAAAEPVFKQ